MISNIKITKNIDEANCITHSGTFHADEIFATLILSKILQEITLIRVQEFRDNPKDNVLVYDIGAGKYDHHQLGGNGQRQNGVKYAACGLIWKEFGKQLLKKYNVGCNDDSDFKEQHDLRNMKFIPTRNMKI